ncbi:hypothetical protein [Pseudomonas fluorescens]|uniref:Uncharacterized protein n=1 Tax=Pseudomonas fluorescens TaxID=294 RepID=A0A5E6XVY7_PSEFL|nr:hypothetical protein [Pseudomonas fluorescens]VVN45688.1 hypothetical protein PS655_05797 [Pseudomonas fluorescens]
MAKQFVWDADKDQVYDSSYGSQTVTCSNGVSFAKHNSTFVAQQANVVFKQVAMVSPQRTPWSGTKNRNTISVLSGDVAFDFGNYSSFVYLYSNSTAPGLIVTGGGRLTISNLSGFIVDGDIEVSGGTLHLESVNLFSWPEMASTLLINRGGTLSVDVFEKNSACKIGRTVVEGGSMSLRTGAIYFGSGLRSANSTIDLQCDNFSLSGSGGVGSEFDYSFRRSSKTSIVADKSVALSEGVKFSLADDASLSIAGIDPEVFSGPAKFKFDFDTKQSEVECLATLVLEPANPFMENLIWANEYITIDGSPVSREDSWRKFTKVLSVNPSTQQTVVTIKMI